MPRQRPAGAARVASRGTSDPADPPAAKSGAAGTATARAGRGAEVVFASADARQGTPQKAKLAAMQGRTIYRRRDGSVRQKNALDTLADILLAPFPADVRIKVRRAAR